MVIIRTFLFGALAFSLMAAAALGQEAGEQKAEPATETKEKTADAEKSVAKVDALAKNVPPKFVPEPFFRPKPTPTPSQADPAAQAAPAASNGTNPAELITRIEVKYQYQNFSFGDIHGVAIVRGDYAFTPKIALRVDLPILHFDSKTPGQKSESGIGDIVTSLTFVKVFSKRFVGALVPRIDFPTATHDTLGSGKYSFKPLIAGITPLAPGMGLVGTLEYRVSFAGKENRADIHETSVRAILLKSFLKGPLKGYYANPQLELIVDFERNNRTTTQFAVNVGKVLSKNVVVFVIPTFHIAGTKKESFKLEAGFRYLFR